MLGWLATTTALSGIPSTEELEVVTRIACTGSDGTGELGDCPRFAHRTVYGPQLPRKKEVITVVATPTSAPGGFPPKRSEGSRVGLPRFSKTAGTNAASGWPTSRGMRVATTSHVLRHYTNCSSWFSP